MPPRRDRGDDWPIDILIFHGYLLRGTGSNVYNANLAQALAALGHRVHLFCQDPEAAEIDWVDRVGIWGDGGLELADGSGRSPGDGAITAYRPPIGSLLPVYVKDRYVGFEVKTFSELDDEELDRYVSANVAAVREIWSGLAEPGAALANHLVMGPAILARAGIAYVAKVHGSALSYTVRPDPRYLPYAREGMAAASAVLVGSRHTAESLWETVGDPGLPARTRLGPPGVDVDRFVPLSREEGGEALLRLARELDRASTAAGQADPADEGDSFSRDSSEAARALEALAGAEGPRISYVGKLIVSKGCDLLLAAWPLVHAAHPGARLLLGGFGSYREPLESLWAAISAGDPEAARAIAAAGRHLEGGGEPAVPLPILSAFLADPPPGWHEAALGAAGSVDFAGRLEHDEVAIVFGASDAAVVPSTFPEAFGMVAAEAAAAGALPVCADHSGLAEVAGALGDALGPERELEGITAFEVGPGSVEAIAGRLDRWLGLEPDVRGEAAAALSEEVAARWSWKGLARGLISACEGDLESLPAVPAD